ncbi:membrane-bound lytic murein transglycosylase MltF [Halioxenophilus sp. WMMB6]|uniref:membrane-bound lytic murein transglycosylase MltF n=1 Tax=Halioxenophilus sp. WMMB6 TaxID=3073815 RepID=UPI00295EB516|nr:membrane-bound lytic murein transglycosylase MltF [Halioxenophilus sp. WMMB6]
MNGYKKVQSAVYQLLKATLLTGVVLGLCTPLIGSHVPTELESVYTSGQLNAVSRNGPTTYYEGSNGTTGLEYDLLKAFAAYLGVELVLHEEDSLPRLMDQVTHHQFDIGAAGITITQERQQTLRFTEPYQEVNELLVYNRQAAKPTSLEDLVGKKIMVIAGSSHANRLRELQASIPQLRWAEHSEADMTDLIEMVHKGEIDYTIADSNAFALTEKIFPRAGVAMELSGSQKLAWAFARSPDNSLFNKAQAFMQEIKANGQLEELIAAHQLPLDLDQGGALTIAQRIESRLPQWEHYLKQAGETYNLEWELLAAISYQESHWNDRARSYTGVRGLMMLTQTTAKEMGISNRLDPVQSIFGGAKYFKSIFERIPARIQGDDRLWLALAAYNVGMGHLEDARKLTEGLGGNPDSWEDVKANLPLLAKRAYYRHLKHGYARGWEPVQYVENIQRYYTVIAWHDTFNNHAVASSGQDPHSDVRPVTFQNDEVASVDLPFL